MFTSRIFHGLQSTLGLDRPRGPRRKPARNALATRRLRHEPLEDRRLLSVAPGWLATVGGEDADAAYAVATDLDGNVYVTGYFSGDIDLSSHELLDLSSAGSRDILVAKYSSDGALQWAKGFGATGDDRGRDIAVNGSHVHVTGSFSGTVDFGVVGPPFISTDGSADMFVLQLDAENGNSTWAKQVGGSGTDAGEGIAVEGDSVYVTGHFHGDMDFNDGEGELKLSTPGDDYDVDAFLLELGSDGSFSDAQRAGGVDHDYGRGIAIGTDGEVFLGGGFRETATFPTGDTAISAGSYDLFLLKFNPQLGRIHGNVFADLNYNGLNDDGAAFPGEATVYLDLNGDGILDEDEPSTKALGTRGEFTFGNLAPGTYTLGVDKEGWKTSDPLDLETGNTTARQVTLTADTNVVTGVEVGAFLPNDAFGYWTDVGSRIHEHTIRTVGFNIPQSFPTADPPMHQYEILDLDVWVEVTHGSVSDLDLTLIVTWIGAGYSMPLLTHESGEVQGANLAHTVFDQDAALSISEGSAPYDGSMDASDGSYRPTTSLDRFDLKQIAGDWKLRYVDRVKNHVSGTLDQWGINVRFEVPQSAEDMPPEARADWYSVGQDLSLDVGPDSGLFENDTERDVLSVNWHTDPAHGTLVLNETDGSFTYTPDPDFLGIDSFQYKASDGQSVYRSNDTVVYLSVMPDNSPPNDAPVAGNDPESANEALYVVDEDFPLTVDATYGVLANDTDPDGGPGALTAVLMTAPSNGSVTLNLDGSFVYTPDTNFNGTDSFTYVANDGQDDSAEATVTITVNPVQDSPAADAGGSYTVAPDDTVVLDASGSTDPDLPGETLSYAWDLDGDGIFGETENGAARGDEVGVSPTFDAAGLSVGASVTVGLLVTDSASNTDTATATITVEEASLERVYNSSGDSARISDMKTVTSTVLATFDDPIVALNVRIDLTHADAANLQVWLIDPNGTALNLASSLDSGDLVYGVVIPEVTTLQHAGTWTLEITDTLKDRKRGTLYDWSLIANPTAPRPSLLPRRPPPTWPCCPCSTSTRQTTMTTIR